VSSQTLLTPSIISKESLVILQNNLVAAGKVNRQFENQFVKIGTTLTVRKPNRFLVSSGPALQIQNIAEPSTSISINTQKHVDWQFSSQDLTLTVEEFRERYIKPGMEEMASALDFDVITNFNQIYNEVGTPGTVPSSFSSLANVGQRADEEAWPQDGRVLILNPAAYWSMANGLSGLFVVSVAEPALKGFLAAIANFEIYMDQNIQSQTVGAYAGTGVVNGANQTGSNLVTNGWTASITGLLNVGDVITVAGVNAINPKNRTTTGSLRNFVVTAAVNSDGSGNATIPIYPSITPAAPLPSGSPYATVTASPASGAAITVKGTASTSYAQNLGFVRDCIGLVMVPLEIPQGVDFAARQEHRNLSLRVIRAYDINNDVFPTRVDMLYGTTTFYPELGCRLTN
jgi:coat protein Gp5